MSRNSNSATERVAILAVVFGAAVGAACGIDAIGAFIAASPGDAGSDDALAPRPDASPGDDAGDGGATTGDAGADSGDAGIEGGPLAPLCDAGAVYCNGTCVAGNDCKACSGAKLFCARLRSCDADCTSCPARPIQCVACDSSQNNPIGTCEAIDAGGFCLNANYGSGEHCDCSNTQVANCIVPNHVCLPAGGTDWCVTCGEQGLVTNGKACKGGGTCNATKSPPGCE